MNVCLCVHMNLNDLSPDNRAQIAETFQLLSDMSRLSIVLTCHEKASSVGNISEKLGLSQSLVSHHLRLLRAAKILDNKRDGKQVYYKLADACVKDVLTIMAGHVLNHNEDHNQEI